MLLDKVARQIGEQTVRHRDDGYFIVRQETVVYQPLRRQSTQIKKLGKRTRKRIVYTKWEVPDHPLVP